MADRTVSTPPSSSPSSFFARLGQEFVWVIVALLFCLVEAAVKLTEFQPRFGARSGGPTQPARREQRGVFAG